MISILVSRDKLFAVQAGKSFETDVTIPSTWVPDKQSRLHLVLRILWHTKDAAAEIQLLEPWEVPGRIPLS